MISCKISSTAAVEAKNKKVKMVKYKNTTWEIKTKTKDSNHKRDYQLDAAGEDAEEPSGESEEDPEDITGIFLRFSCE